MARKSPHIEAAETLVARIKEVFKANRWKVTKTRIEPLSRMARVYIVAPVFAQMSPYERQGLMWRIARDELDERNNYLIAAIVPLSPKEARDWGLVRG